ncbi:MAG: 5-formyltetrahydrofolate cyclo-ligase [Bacteroidota bacterium]
MLKRNLRYTYSALRKDFSGTSLLNASLHVTRRSLELPIWSLAYYHIFLPIVPKKEINTAFLLSILQGKGKKIVVPRVSGSNTLQNCLLSEDTKFKKSNWGIPEPTDCLEVSPGQIDVVFLPLLIFDVVGNRVGYGKGFYDIFLKQCRPDVVKVGLCLFDPVEVITDIHDGDIALDYCVTPKKSYSFSSAS